MDQCTYWGENADIRHLNLRLPASNTPTLPSQKEAYTSWLLQEYAAQDIGAERTPCGSHCKGEYMRNLAWERRYWIWGSFRWALYLVNAYHVGSIIFIYCNLRFVVYQQPYLVRVELHSSVTTRGFTTRYLHRNTFSFLPRINAPNTKLLKI